MLINTKYTELIKAKDSYLGPDVKTVPIPAPVGGLDAVSPLANMQPHFAPILTNWTPRPGWVELRGGYSVWCQGLSTGAVETLMAYKPANAAEKLFAAANNQIWDVTSYGSPFVSLSSLANNRWQYANFTPSGSSSYLICANGSDSVREYDGTTWSTPTITGVTSSTLITVNSHQRRLWFIQANSTTVWYLGTGSISGAATALEIGPLLTKGGYLLAMGSWTVDGGNGPNNLAVFMSSRGQAVIYQGTDPTSSTTWSLVGVFNLPTPIPSRRCITQIGSDLGILTLDGLIPLSKALPFNPSGVRSSAFTQKIQNAMLQAAQNGYNEFGWQTILFPLESLMIVNFPVTEGVTQQQFVMNGISGSWAMWSGWNANCFEILDNSLYFGDNAGNVCLAYTGGLDSVTPITADMQCAFNFFEQPGRIKTMSMVRPFITADGTLTPTIAVDVDFATADVTAAVQTLTPTGGL